MILGFAAILALAAALFVAVAWPRVDLRRRLEVEGIEDREAVEAYDRISRWPQFRLLRHLIVRELRRYRPQGVLADMGCGPGRLSVEIARAFPHLQTLGVDASEAMIRAAAANASSLGPSVQVRFLAGNVLDLPLQDEAIDFAISTLSLHHWSDAERGLSEIHRVLKPGGQLLLFDLRRDPRRLFYLLLRFAQACVVPAALRRAGEPVGSVLSSHTPRETDAYFSRSQFEQWRVRGGIGWMFVWGQKRDG